MTHDARELRASHAVPRDARDLRVFQLAVAVVVVVPIVVGGNGALGGLEGLARLFGEDRDLAVSPGLRNHLRALCWMFAMIAPLAAWTVRADTLVARTGAFRIVAGFACAAGAVRALGTVVDGWPGPVALALFGVEVAGLPALLVWHARLVRRARSAP